MSRRAPTRHARQHGLPAAELSADDNLVLLAPLLHARRRVVRRPHAALDARPLAVHAAARAAPAPRVVAEQSAARLDLDFGRVVAVEEARVELDAADGAAVHAEAVHDVVVGMRVVAAGLPAVVPGALRGEDAGFLDRGSGRGEVCGRTEEFVGGVEETGVQARGEEVCGR